MTDREDWFVQEMQAARDILTEASTYLSHDDIWTVNRLLAAEEPTEALLFLASYLAPHRDELPEAVVRLLKEVIGTVNGVHPAFRR